MLGILQLVQGFWWGRGRFLSTRQRLMPGFGETGRKLIIQSIPSDRSLKSFSGILSWQKCAFNIGLKSKVQLFVVIRDFKG